MESQQQILGLAKKRESIQDQINRKKSQIADIQKGIDKYDEQLQYIDKQIANIKYKDAKNDVDNKKNAKGDPNTNPMEVEEEADAATTTGSLDAASQSSGGDYGGWRHYSKVGQTLKRNEPKKAKKMKKKKNIYNYMDHVWDDSIDDGE